MTETMMKAVRVRFVAVWYVVLWLLSGTLACGREVELTIWPAEAGATARQLHFVPAAEDLIDADAVPLYGLAVQAAPSDVPSEKIDQWRKMQPGQMPLDRVREVLDGFGTAFTYLDQAAACRKSQWPAFVPGRLPANLSEYRTLAKGLCLRAHLELAHGQYEKAAATIGTGLIMAEHLGRAENLTQNLVGIAIAALMYGEIEQFIQQRGSPSLYQALEDLKTPLIDVAKTLDAEIANIRRQYNLLTARAMIGQLAPAHNKVRLISNRLLRQRKLLQCIEAIRLFAGENGRLPGSLVAIAQVPVPNDPLDDESFEYEGGARHGVLKAAVPKGGDPKDGFEYKLRVGRED